MEEELVFDCNLVDKKLENRLNLLNYMLFTACYISFYFLNRLKCTMLTTQWYCQGP